MAQASLGTEVQPLSLLQPLTRWSHAAWKASEMAQRCPGTHPGADGGVPGVSPVPFQPTPGPRLCPYGATSART